MRNSVTNIFKIIGFIIGPLIWFILKYYFEISDRYLPTPISVLDSFYVIEPNIFVHFIWSLARLLIGYTGGALLGITLGLIMFSNKYIYESLYPIIQSLRSVPAAATVPFFLLWFGFDEIGKFLLIFTGIAFNLAITVIEILSRIPDKFLIFFRSINSKPERYMFTFSLPFILERILPTLRFSLSTSIGLVVVSEFLGSQIGLGYLIQTSRSTFSLNVIFAAVLLFGIMNFLVDKILTIIWSKIVYWKS